MMKGSIESSINEEVGENMDYHLNEMKKVLKLMDSLAKGEEVEIEMEEEKVEEKTTTNAP